MSLIEEMAKQMSGLMCAAAAVRKQDEDAYILKVSIFDKVWYRTFTADQVSEAWIAIINDVKADLDKIDAKSNIVLVT